MTKTEELLAYFDRLIAADKSGYLCQREMAEVIAELRLELRLVGGNGGEIIMTDCGRKFVKDSNGVLIQVK